MFRRRAHPAIKRCIREAYVTATLARLSVSDPSRILEPRSIISTGSTMYDQARCRQQAERCREEASLLGDPAAAEVWLKFAARYEALAGRLPSEPASEGLSVTRDRRTSFAA